MNQQDNETNKKNKKSWVKEAVKYFNIVIKY